MSFEFVQNLQEGNIQTSDYLRVRAISSMDCNEYKQKIFPETPRIKPQKAPDLPLLELELPPILEEPSENEMNIEKTCCFSLNQQQYQPFDEMIPENDSISTISMINSIHMKSQFSKKKFKQFKLESQNRNRAASAVLPRFSIYTFLKKIIRKQKHNGF